MQKVYLLDNGMRNCLVNNFQSVSERLDKGMIWENTAFRLLSESVDTDEIKYWRTSAGNEVDFVINSGTQSGALEVKYSKTQIMTEKYKLFRSTYPDLNLSFLYMEPFDEDFFRRIPLFREMAF